MNTNVIEPLRYGATELRAGYNRNLGFALGVSIAAHLVVIGLYMLISRDSIGTALTPPVWLPPRIIIDQARLDFEPPAGQSGSGGDAAGSTSAGSAGSTEVAGTPSLADPLDSTDLSFATLGNIGTALPFSGDDPAGVIGRMELNRTSSGTGTAPASTPDAALEPDEFVAVEEYPTFDAAELARNVRYPELARRNSVEGTVIVRVLIDRNGRAVKTLIDQSANVTLDDAAREAVMNTTYTPAVQNKVPVAVWMQVPVLFQLR